MFLLGPSGAGKSKLSEWVAEDTGFLHIEIDRWPDGDGIDLAGLRNDWNTYLESGDPSRLAAAIRKRIRNARKQGAILSFPSTLVLAVPQMKAAEEHGIRPIVLYGTDADCLGAFLRREAELGRGLATDHWVQNNARTYAQFSRPE